MWGKPLKADWNKQYFLGSVWWELDVQCLETVDNFWWSKAAAAKQLDNHIKLNIYTEAKLKVRIRYHKASGIDISAKDVGSKKRQRRKEL